MRQILEQKKTDILLTLDGIISPDDLALVADLIQELIDLAIEHLEANPPSTSINVASVDMVGQILADQLAPIQNTLADVLLAFLPVKR